ncbi:unnamed protein product [Schistocephalus solidus]|uniref:Ubiquitin-like domain-containing protein n=1 Tax=Schistocephalus solidus TaxID=70667 RepID=A0A183TP88_SCHSO|nr:unnamed protein product [Schistocephalus solidus]
MDAENSGPPQDFRVRDPVLPSQLQYAAEAAEMEMIQLPGLVRVDGSGLRSIKECHQDDGLLHLQCGVQVGSSFKAIFMVSWDCIALKLIVNYLLH